jgi:hypothetical protein
VVKSWFGADGSLKPGAGALTDPYGQELRQRGQSPFRCERTRPNILSQALCFACVHNRLEVADFLLTQGADINAIVPGLDMKATVLHCVATANGRFARSEIETVIRFLLDRGADPAIRDEVYHSTPIGWAWHFSLSDSVDLLIDRAGIHDAVGCDQPARVRMLLAHDPGLASASDEDGETPLHRLRGALTHGTEMIDLLVQHHADVNAPDGVGSRSLPMPSHRAPMIWPIVCDPSEPIDRPVDRHTLEVKLSISAPNGFLTRGWSLPRSESARYAWIQRQLSRT